MATKPKKPAKPARDPQPQATAQAGASNVAISPSAKATAPALADPVGSVGAVPPDALAALDRYATRGRNHELLQFEALMAPERYRHNGRPVTVWQFIEHACEGSGGFADGTYLVPFRLELESEVGFGVSAKYRERQALSDFDRFAGHIATAPWDLIVSQHTLRMDSADPRVNGFWENCDGQGTRFLDFAEYPHVQSRRYGTSVVIVDRPDVPLLSEADNMKPENAPYCYSMPTYYVQDWKFGDDGQLDYLIFAVPEEGQMDVMQRVTVRVWTRESVTLFRPTKTRASSKSADDWIPISTRPNLIGVVPAVLWHNDLPAPGRFLAPTEMLDVAKKAQTWFNMRSECREIQRHCASPFLFLPVRDSDTYDAEPMIIGTEVVITGDGPGAPVWVQMSMDALKDIREDMQITKDSAYGDAGLRGLAADIIKTSSGLHAEVEFSRTERSVAGMSAMGEIATTKVTVLVLLYHGIKDAGQAKKLFTVSWPREFGVRDLDKMLDRCGKELALELGEGFDREFITDYARGRFPRKSGAEIETMVDAAMAEIKANKAAEMAAQQAAAKSVDPALDPASKGLGGIGAAENGA